MSEETLKLIAQRLDAFQKGFDAITKSISTSLTKIEKQSEALAANTTFLPKIVADNKENKKSTEKLELIVDTLMRRLDKIILDKGYM